MAEPKRANLHFHSIHSDGRQWPAEMAARCAAAGFEVAALTDHDTFAGVPAFLAACKFFGVEGIAGVEMDCVAPEAGYAKELLGYYPGGGYARSAALLAPGIAARAALMERLVASCREAFGREDLTMDGLREYKAGFVDDRVRALEIAYVKVDLYRYLKRAGAVPADLGYRDFKDRFRGETQKPHLRDVAAAIRADGGYPVLPHPGFILDEEGESTFRALLELCRASGVWGVELYWYHSPEKSARLNAAVEAMAAPMGFRFTHGSDCHGRGSEFDALEKYAGPFAGFAG